jgi:hypothetical protein
MTASGVPAPIVTQFQAGLQSGAVDLGQLTGTGDLGTTILANIPEAFRAQVQPFIGNIVEGIHAAFSLAVAQTFWIGVGAAIIAAIAAMFMQELALRQSTSEAQERAQAAAAKASTEARDGRPAVPAAD